MIKVFFDEEDETFVNVLSTRKTLFSQISFPISREKFKVQVKVQRIQLYNEDQFINSSKGNSFQDESKFNQV